MQEAIITIFIAILGGVGLYYIPKWIKKGIYRFKPVLTYQFDDEGTGKGSRRIHHSFGESVEDKDASNGKAWKHTTAKINDGKATCYGPYTKEIPFRGKYKAVFRIKTSGIKNINSVFLVIDVAHGEKDTSGRFNTLGLPLVEKAIKGKEFKDGVYKKFSLQFEYDGQSLIEFRCILQNLIHYEDDFEEISFDDIRVFQLSEIL